MYLIRTGDCVIGCVLPCFKGKQLELAWLQGKHPGGVGVVRRVRQALLSPASPAASQLLIVSGGSAWPLPFRATSPLQRERAVAKCLFPVKRDIRLVRLGWKDSVDVGRQSEGVWQCRGATLAFCAQHLSAGTDQDRSVLPYAAKSPRATPGPGSAGGGRRR